MKKWRRWFSRNKWEQDLSEELRFHIEQQTAANVAAGMPHVEARRRAMLQLGAVEGVKETCREETRGFWLESVWADVRYAASILRRSPGFTIVAVLTLALGTGANTAIFSVIETVLLRPLPYKNAESIVWATERFPFNHDSAAVLSPDFIAFRDGNDVFEQISASGGSSGANLTGVGEPDRVNVTNVTTGYFPMLGVQPLLGRGFLPAEGKQAESNVALLNESLWRTRFGADEQIVGRTINLDGTAYTVVGVMPANIRYPRADVWTPFALDSEVFSTHSPRWTLLTLIARLKPGVTIAQAQSNLQVLIHQMDQQYPPEAARFRAGARADVVPLHDVLVHDVRSQLLILLGAVGLVLLIACANVANLLLSRSASRSREIAIRAALGAGRRRLIRQMLIESLLLATTGGALGLVSGLWGTQLLKQLIPPSLPSTLTLEWKTFVFVAALAIFSVLLFGLAPALMASIVDVNEALKNGPVARQYKSARLRSFLVLGEISLSLVLLSGAGLLVRSFLHLSQVELGFEPGNLLLATVQRPLTLGDSSQQHAVFFSEATDRIRALPGVLQVAATRQYPLGELNNAALGLYLTDGTTYRAGTPILVDSISLDYFQTIGIRLLKGRAFEDRDSANAEAVAILSESLARHAFKDHNPLGQQFKIGPTMPQLTIVGVVSNVRNGSLDREFLPEIYVPFVQEPSFNMTFVIRSKGDPHNLASGVRQAVAGIDKNQPVSELQAMDDVLATSVAPQRFRMQLLGLFALLALALAAIGVYGVIAYSVSQRTFEIGIRMALGAERSNIFKLIVGQGVRLALGGVAIGIAVALILARLVSSFSQLLYGVDANDPPTIIVVSTVSVVVAILACYIPARRAMRVDPMIALRYE
jgi:predicted permease